MIKKESNTIKSLNFFNMMYSFLIIVELIHIYFSYATGVGSINKILLAIIFLILALLFKFKYDCSEDVIKIFSVINLSVLFGYLVISLLLGHKVFFAGLYLIEVATVLTFSNFKLKTKVIIHISFGIVIWIAFTVFSFNSKIIDLNSLFIIGLFIVILMELFLSERIKNYYKYLISSSTQKTKQIVSTNKFLTTILEQEKIRIIYYYPDNHSAILVSNNFTIHNESNIPNLMEFIQSNNLISIEYFGMMQNAIDLTIKEGSFSIVLPINLNHKRVWMKMNGAKIIEDDSKRIKIIVSITNVNDLKTIEYKFKNALKQCSIAIWEYDIKNDKIVNYSDAILDYYFYGKEIDIASTTLLSRNIVYYRDVDVFKEGFEKVKSGESHVSFEIRIFPSRSNSYTWIRITFTCFKDYKNNPSTAWVTVENIDDAKASEKWFEIERTKNFDNRNGLIFMAELNVSRNFVISYNSKFNDSFNSLTDNSIDSLLNCIKNLNLKIDGDNIFYERLTQDFLLQNYEKGERVLEYEYKIITESKDVFYIANVLKLFLDLKTKEVIAFVFVYDITESNILKLSMDSIIRSKFVYLAYVNTLNAHMTISRTQLIDVTNTANPFRIYKDEWEVFVEKYVHPEDRKYVLDKISIENVVKMIEYRRSFSFDYRLTDGGNMMSLRRCHFVKTESDSPYLIILEENVSNEMISRIRHELVLKAALKQATEAATAKSEFLSRMSHEIRTPLSAIIGLSELGTSSYANDSKDYFNKINDSGQYLLGLMNDILDMNKLELGQVKLNPEYVDTEDFFDIILTIIRNQAIKKNIDFTFKQEGPIYRYQYFEKLRVQQILLNVLNNAIKYTHNNGKVSYVVKNIEEDGKLYTIHEVEDNGVGISEEFLDKVFKPFTRENNSLSDTEGGTGLGLAICSNLVKQLNGDIKIESKLNQGTKLVIKLPLTVASENEYLKKTSDKDNFDESKMFIGKKILIAEDHQINAMIISTILNNRGIKTVHVTNGIEALKAFSKSKENEFDLILMDIMMPELDGLEATKRIRQLERKDSKSIPIIALSANAFEEDKLRSLASGMNDHLKKPIETKVLLKALNKYL